MTAFVDVIRPANKSAAFLFDLCSIIGGSLLIAFSAWISIPLIFTPVPMTMQLLAILLIGAVLGSKRGALAVLCYLVEGGLGLPVFATGFGLWGPTAGYRFGFVLAAFLIGLLLERGPKERFFYTIFTMTLGTLLIWACGALWLSHFVGGFDAALKLGVLPFLAVDGLKILIAASLVPAGWKLISAFR